uniref:Uncharacterized protein n=1 Tax=Physcomitrium patens TaxID=3218 RepID=A0A2K1JUE2_PHYPA|nr:hypothetical protein PHYPA_014924 [Physcomitrium patens]
MTLGLHLELSKAIAVAKGNVSGEDGAFTIVKRQVEKHPRAGGYKIAICKSRWNHAGSYHGGDYHYIDVLLTDATKKIVRDLEDNDAAFSSVEVLDVGAAPEGE